MPNPSGKYLSIRDPKLGIFEAFVPDNIDGRTVKPTDEMQAMERKAIYALGSLNSITDFLPDPDFFLYSYIRKEAILSSQIEGTQSSLSDLLLYENKVVPGVPESDVVEVSSYITALQYGHQRLLAGKPIDREMIKELHALLLSKGRGKDKMPGIIRTGQNWVGGDRPSNAQYVPPPAESLDSLIENFTEFIVREQADIPSLEKAGMIHAQFESIHPFYDGNGRVGRMLISLILAREGLLQQPILYLSLYLKKNRYRYYELLQLVREEGGWEAWLMFFYKGIAEVAGGAVNTAKKLLKMFDEDKRRIETVAGRSVATVLRVHDVLKKEIVVRPRQLATQLDITPPTAHSALRTLSNLRIVEEITGKQRYSVYAYQKYLDILSEGAEPESNIP